VLGKVTVIAKKDSINKVSIFMIVGNIIKKEIVFKKAKQNKNTIHEIVQFVKNLTKY